VQSKTERLWFFCVAILIGAAVNPAATAGPRGQRIHEKLAGIIVPRVQFEEVTIEEAIRFIRKKSKELDPDHVGINVFLRQAKAADAPSKRASITIEANNLPLADVVRYTCMAAGLNYNIDETSLIIADPSVPMTKMETRFYNVECGVLSTAGKGRR